MMNRDGDSSAQPKAPRCQRQQHAQHIHNVFQKTNRNPSTEQLKDAHGCSKNKPSVITGTQTTRRVNGKEKKTDTCTRLWVAELGATECQINQNARRKLSDASNVSEDLSKDSGCVSGKVSSSDSSSEISDCQSEGNKVSSDLSGSDAKALARSGGDTFTSVTDMRSEGDPSSRTWQDNAIYSAGDGYESPGFCGDSRALDVSVAGYCDVTGELLGETTEDLLREVDDLRSENEYLKDEVEELRCEMLEMRDVFLEEEVFQAQELQQQLDVATKTCRILQYRLRKAERRSMRVAQTGQGDGELVRTLEQDVKVAKSVSVRLHGELENVQQKNGRLERENQGLRERLQDLEVSRQVLQAEMEKAREISQNSVKRRSIRSPNSKPEKKLSPQDDSADLKLQLHFAKEESALMCKKLSRLSLESEALRDEVNRFRSAYGDVDAACSSAPGASSSPYAREAEVKVHLRLVEEEATLLSRRIVELEVENRGLRAEMSDLRERGGGGGEGEEEEEELAEGVGERRDSLAQVKDREKGEGDAMRGYAQSEDAGTREERGRGVAEHPRVRTEFPLGDDDRSPAERMFSQSRISREGPIGGERDPLDGHKGDSAEESGRAFDGRAALLALRNHACLVSSAIQLLSAPAQNSPCSPPLSPCSPPLSPHLPRSEADRQDEARRLQRGHVSAALELLQTMLLAFVGGVESLVTSGGEPSFQRVPGGWDDTGTAVPLPGACAPNDNISESAVRQESVRQESVRQESVRQGSVRQESVRQESVRQGSVRQESVRQESVRQESVRQESAEELCAAETKERAKPARQGFAPPLTGCADPITRVTLEILWVLHQRCLGERSAGPEGKEVRETHVRVLQSLLLELGSELQEEGLTDRGTKGPQRDTAESPVNTTIREGRSLECKRTYSKDTKHRLLKSGSKQKNRCYLSHEAAQLDPGDPFRTWDHPCMPLSFPGLDPDRATAERSHTAPETTSLCIYYSPPSARRVQLANQKKSSVVVVVRNSPAPSVSPGRASSRPVASLCSRLSANLSDDMKEMTAGVRQAAQRSDSLERRKGRVCEGWLVDVACSATQTQAPQRPRMVNVGLQTDDGQCIVGAVRASPPRAPPSSSSAPLRSHHLSLERMPGRANRPRSGSPKLYRRPSSSTPSSLSSLTASSPAASSSLPSSSPSSSAAPRERVLLTLSHQRGAAQSAWVRPASARTGPAPSHGPPGADVISQGRSHAKPPSKPTGVHRYGLVGEFLRRVSGRTDKGGAGGAAGAAGTGPKGKAAPKSTERPPPSATRPPTAPLHRNDSITRIVNQRFMKQREEGGRGQREEGGRGQREEGGRGQREEGGRGQREEKGPSPNQAARAPVVRDQSLSTVTSEDGSDECSSKTLTFCFARSSRPAQRQASNHAKLRRHGYSPTVGGSGEPNCE